MLWVSCEYRHDSFNELITGVTNWRFEQVHDTPELDDVLRRLNVDGDIRLACINDDQPDESSEGYAERFNAWIHQRWGWVKAGWERGR
jgi:hypothetical protein